MPEQTQLIHPTLDLFLYDLREGLGQDTQKVAENRTQFWQRIYNNSQNNSSASKIQDETFLAQLQEVEKLESSFIELLGSDIVKHFERPLEGYYYPVQIEDTYALHVDCSGVYVDGIRQSNYKPQPLENLRSIQAEIISHINKQPGTIGQTWMVWGQLIDAHQNPTQIALECYKQLAPEPHNWQRDLKSQGQFLGATVFELWRSPSNWSDRESLIENYHLLIWLFPPNKSIKSVVDSVTEIYLDLIHLFCYRNKVLWAYCQSCQLKAELNTDSISIQNTIRDVSQLTQQKKPSESQMKQLREVLTNTLILLSRYVLNLGDLKTQGRTIEINLENYTKRLSAIAQVEQGSNLQFLADFSDFARTKYLQQVEMDYANLGFSLTVLENLIRTVEGITGTYQTQSDRSLNSTIAAASVGLTTSAVLATTAIASSVLITQPSQSKNVVSFQATAFGSSVIVGAITGLIAWRILRH